MCGFVGYFGGTKIDLEPASKEIIHRGPDDQKILYEKDWGVAFNRLSIIDTSHNGMQPFVYDQVTVFLNGEIYNYIELKKKYEKLYKCKTKSDVEIVPFLYRHKGIEFLNEINGMFSMVIIDEKFNKKYLIKDRYGKKPLFYNVDNNKIYFASELKCLNKLSKLNLSKINLPLYFYCSFIPEPLTIYDEIKTVLPGSFICFENEKINEKQWYKPQIKYNNNLQEKKNFFLSFLEDSIKFRLRSDVPVGIFLSGGLDSNLILNQAAKKYPNIVSLICDIPSKEKFSKNKTDSVNPEKICSEKGYKFIKNTFDFDYFDKNLIKIISKVDYPILDSGSLIFYQLAEVAKKNGIKVILTGAGGDEIFGGYPWQDKLRLRNKILKMKHYLNKGDLESKIYLKRYSKSIYFRKVFRKFLKLNELIFRPNLWFMECFGSDAQYLMLDKKKSIQEKLNNLSLKYFNITKNFFSKKNYNYISYQNIFHILSLQNYYFDQMCMLHSVENRSPLLDYNIFELMMSVSEKHKISFGKKIFQKKIAKNILPDYILNSPKSGTTLPLNIWLGSRKDYSNKIDEYIKNNLELIKKYISEELYFELKNNINILSENYVSKFNILSFIIWFNIHINKKILNTNISLSKLIN